MIIRASKQNVDMALLGLYNMRVTSYREICSYAPLLVAVVATALVLGCQQAPAPPPAVALALGWHRRTSPPPSS